MLYISDIARLKLTQELIKYSKNNFVRIFIEGFDQYGEIKYALTIDILRKWDKSLMYNDLPICYALSEEDYIEEISIKYDLKKNIFIVKENEPLKYKWEMADE